MHSAIIAVEMPDSEQQWLAFLNASGTVPPNAATRQLAANVWQIYFEDSPTTFARLIDAMRKFGVGGEILRLGAESQWLPVDSNPQPT
jgi:hypothetical protein